VLLIVLPVLLGWNREIGCDTFGSSKKDSAGFRTKKLKIRGIALFNAPPHLDYMALLVFA
jgi:hypothetical protein